jgi:hypothetical protein
MAAFRVQRLASLCAPAERSILALERAAALPTARLGQPAAWARTLHSLSDLGRAPTAPGWAAPAAAHCLLSLTATRGFAADAAAAAAAAAAVPRHVLIEATYVGERCSWHAVAWRL